MELRPAELFKELKSGSLRPVYYLLGEETSGKSQSLAILKDRLKSDDFNFRIFSEKLEDEIPSLLSELGTLPVFTDKRLVVVSSPTIPAAVKKTLAQYLEEPLKSTALIIICEERKADLKDALTRAASSAGALCVFSPLRDEEAQKRLQATAKESGKTLSDEAAAALVREAGTDWPLLAQELEKAILFSSSKTINEEDMLQCLGYRKAADPFALSRLIQERKLKESLTHLRRFLKEGKHDEQAFKALSQMSGSVQKQLRAKIMQKAKVPSAEIFKALRLHAYWDRDFLGSLGQFSENRLAADLKKCVATEAALKSKAWLDPGVEIESLAVNLCKTTGVPR